MAGRWVDVAEAARELDISTDAVRKRIARGSLESDRPDGNVLVWLDDGGTEAGREAEVDGVSLVEVLREQVAYLRGVIATRDQELATRAEEIRRRDAALEREQQLTAFFAERLRELKAPSQDRPEAHEEAPESAEPRPGTPAPPEATTGAQEEAAEAPEGEPRRGFWSRLFGS